MTHELKAYRLLRTVPDQTITMPHDAEIVDVCSGPEDAVYVVALSPLASRYGPRRFVVVSAALREVAFPVFPEDRSVVYRGCASNAPVGVLDAVSRFTYIFEVVDVTPSVQTRKGPRTT